MHVFNTRAAAARWRGYWCQLVALLAFALAGCSEAGPEPAQAQGPTGTLELNLIGQSAQGRLFQLRNAIVMVQGPSNTLFFDTEADPERTTLSAVVPAGFHSAFLQEGWQLQRLDSGKPVADASLLSPNPQFFDVFEGQRTRVALRFRAGTDEVVNNPGVLEIGIEVEEGPSQSTLCSSDADCRAGQVCCIGGFLGTCLELAPGAACPLPDLTVSFDAAAQSLSLAEESFAPNSCAIEEGCVAAPGVRRLLRFATMTPNIGDLDLTLGDPSTTPGFEFAPCHGHFHFEGYARYELLDTAGAVVATGHKQAFCLLDSTPVGLPGALTSPRFHCGFQGLQRGWADIYGPGLDCQWVDVTDVPEGDYVLRISINPDHVIDESDFSNNTAEIPVTLGSSTSDPLRACGSGGIPDSGSGASRECGWSVAAGFEGQSCNPGDVIQLGCGCPLGTCQGDPMLRVCEGTDACSFANALAGIDDACGVCPQVSFTCPPSGTFSALVAPFSAGTPFVCEPVQG